MSARQCLHVALADISALRLECEKCGAAVSVKPPTPEGGFDHCPNCRTTWHRPNPELHALMTLLNEVHATDKENKPERPYRIMFEVERP